MADGEIRELEPEERERIGAADWAICVATFYGDLAERLANGAFEGFLEMGAGAGSVETFEVPGAFELPLAAKLCAESGRFAGVACVGVVIRGETDHYDFVCAEAAGGLRQVTLEGILPPLWLRSECARKPVLVYGLEDGQPPFLIEDTSGQLALLYP